jgi:hypothetical protein
VAVERTAMGSSSDESLSKHKDWLYGDQPEPCRCDHAWVSQGRFMNVNMGMGWSRMNTHPDCLHHAKCHGFTDTLRASGPSWWTPYCPVHRTNNCPKRTAYKVKVPGGGS